MQDVFLRFATYYRRRNSLVNSNFMAVIIILIAVVVGVSIPITVIWAVNVLGLTVAFTLKTWAATLFLLILYLALS